MPYPMHDFPEFLIAMFVSIAPVVLVVWLAFIIVGAIRSDPSPRDRFESRAWDQGREIGRLEQEIADLKRRIADIERRQQPFAGD